MPILRPILARWPLFALLASAAMLAAAHAFETFGHLAPCALCLKQREAYWIALAIASAGIAGEFTPWREPTRRIAAALLTLAFLYGAGLAVYHAGAEWKWWPGPAACTGGAGGVSSGDLEAILKGDKITMPACDKAAWVFLGLSMAGWNALISAGLAALSGAAALRKATA
jgi:disulfide bond formation protein DsbB